MKQYLDILRDLIDAPLKGASRKGLPGSHELFGRSMKFDLSEGFPLLTTKKLYYKGAFHELVWMLRGFSNIDYLVLNNVHIWDDDAYRYYTKMYEKSEGLRVESLLTKEAFVERISEGDIKFPRSKYRLGDVGKSYGYQWRKNGVDQIEALLQNLYSNPETRRGLVTSWDSKFIQGDETYVALPSCHVMFQCSVEGRWLDMCMYQRSCDFFLGVPFNIAFYGGLLTWLAQVLGYKPGILTWFGGSVHLYENHVEQSKEQVLREPLRLPKLDLVGVPSWRPGVPVDYVIPSVEQFIVRDYKSYPGIKAPLSVGL